MQKVSHAFNFTAARNVFNSQMKVFNRLIPNFCGQVAADSSATMLLPLQSMPFGDFRLWPSQMFHLPIGIGDPSHPCQDGNEGLSVGCSKRKALSQGKGSHEVAQKHKAIGGRALTTNPQDAGQQ